MGSATRRTLAAIVSRKARTDSYTEGSSSIQFKKREVEKRRSGENFEQMTVKVTRDCPNPQQIHSMIIMHASSITIPSSILMVETAREN